MKQQPDQLFHKKLRNYSKAVPDSAWNRIAAGIEKKPYAYPFYKLAIAASLLLASFCIYLFWPSSISEQGTITQANEAKSDGAIKQKKEPVIEEHAKKLNIETGDKTPNQKPVEPEYAKTTAPAEPKVVHTTREEESNESPSENNLAAEIIIAENTAEIKIDSGDVTKNDSENLFIVYTAEDTKEYLLKRTPEEATTEDKKASTFKKVLRKARNLKSNKDPYGDLRQMKNEILALNFKSDKERGQKK